MRRSFNQSERLRMFIEADGKCAICGGELGEDWEPDHIIPYGLGGETHIENGQPTCRKCNRKKGAHLKVELREWQRKFYREYTNAAQRDFTLVALPGSGKTIAALSVAIDAINKRLCDGIIIVTPTFNLKDQWKDAANQLDINLQPDFATGKAVWPANPFHGIVTTYAQCLSAYRAFERFCATKNIFVILDEIHHCADQLEWGKAVEASFRSATRRLILSGTLFRQDNIPIPFVSYQENVSKVDFAYDYPLAIRDKIIRYISFEHYEGEFEWISRTGEQVKATFAQELDQQQMGERLRVSLDPSMEWMRSLLLKATGMLLNVRDEEDYPAGGLVIARDINHAQKIHEILSSFPGIRSVIATSDDEDASKIIERFRDSRDHWIVSVKMVSEGVDIKRLRVLVYATNVVTELFFRQAIGRIVRVDRNPDESAYCYLPSDPRLKEYASKITEMQVHVLEEEISQDRDFDRDLAEDIRSDITVLDARNSAIDCITIDGQIYSGGFIEQVRSQAQGIPIDKALRLLAAFGIGGQTREIVRRPEEKSLADRVRELRGEIQSLVNRAAFMSGKEPKYYHLEWLKLGGKAAHLNDIEDLTNKKKWIKDIICQLAKTR